MVFSKDPVEAAHQRAEFNLMLKEKEKQKKHERWERVHMWINTLIALGALLVAIFK